MDLSLIWEDFMARLWQEPAIEDAKCKKYAGIPFIYLRPVLGRHASLPGLIQKSAARAMRGRQLHCETVFVRSGEVYVYRHRFYVPQKKMFCGGNLCPDCIRFEE